MGSSGLLKLLQQVGGFHPLTVYLPAGSFAKYVPSAFVVVVATVARPR